MMPLIFAELGPVEQALLFLIAALVLTLVILLGIFLKLFSRYLDLLESTRKTEVASTPAPASVAAPIVAVAQPVPAVTAAAATLPPIEPIPALANEPDAGELVAVIAAAAASVVNQPHRIVAVQPVAQVQWPTINPWAIEGRVSIFSGRRVR
ncbi:MAG: hypothetical protein WCO56_20630 [Verrucomicrobiota bacterium]